MGERIMQESHSSLPAAIPGEQPNLPATDENALVERFVEASRELLPSIQVALTKRIYQPGSNRVLCLAAHTTMPLDDEQVASVSDLALRLSDGTSVALSLSFFNEQAGSAIPFPAAMPYQIACCAHCYVIDYGGQSFVCVQFAPRPGRGSQRNCRRHDHACPCAER
jgi:hypothetical protein